MKERVIKIFLTVVVAIAPGYALAVYGGYDYDVVGHVTRIDGSFTPSSGNFPFRIDVNAGACSASTWLFYSGNGSTAQESADNRKLMYATLFAAMYSGAPVEVYGYNAGCAVVQVSPLAR